MKRSTRWRSMRLVAPLALALACACAGGDPVGDPTPMGIVPATEGDDDEEGRAFVDSPDDGLDVGFPPIPDLGSGEASTSDALADSESEDDDTAESEDDGPPNGVPTGDCCEPHGDPLCEDIDVLTCVCVQRPACCQVAWDESCVAAVDELVCGSCA